MSPGFGTRPSGRATGARAMIVLCANSQFPEERGMHQVGSWKYGRTSGCRRTTGEGIHDDWVMVGRKRWFGTMQIHLCGAHLTRSFLFGIRMCVDTSEF